MPDFYVDNLEISPSEFYGACTRREKQELIDEFADDGYTIITPGKYDDGVPGRQSDFGRSLDILKASKMMLSLEEENMIIELANKFKYIVTV